VRIAFATNYPPAPAVSGAAIRSHHLARALAARGEVVVYCKAPRDFTDAYDGHPDLAPFAAVRVLPFDEKARNAPNPQFFASIEHWRSDAHPVWAPLAKDHAQKPFDVVVCEQIFTVGAARALRGVPFVLSEHNVESKVLEKIIEPRGAFPAEFHVSVEHARAHEAEVWSAARVVTCVSEADAAHVGTVRGRPALVVPNGVAVERVSFALPTARGGEDVLFIGSFFWPPNAEAARFLAREVMPLVWKTRPRAQLTLCGVGPPPEVLALVQPGVVVTGAVPSLRPYRARAAVYANALFAGEGSSLKALEPLAAGIPLVSTAVGVRGYPLRAGEHYAAAETADEFARAIARALDERASLDEAAKRGRAFAEAYDWASIGRRFADEVERAR
jgi:glycosyltransferase involved in cell wall biosynthesis